MGQDSVAASAPAVGSPRRSRSFYLAMAIVVAGVVVYGFSFTIADNLFHPAYPRPAILYLHAVVFTAWILLFAAQAALVRSRRVDLHRRLGQWGLVHGTLIPIVGVATAVAMTRLRAAHGETEAAASFLIPLSDMVGFSAAFALAAAWRRRPERHRRLIWIATAVLTAAAWGRMPGLDRGDWFYAGVDALIVLGALHDRVVIGRVHDVYRWGLPALVVLQVLTAWVRSSPWWLDLAPRLFT